MERDTSLWAAVFQNFRNMFLEKYELDPSKFLSAPGLAWQAGLKMTKSQIRSFNWYWHAEVNNKYMKGYNKNVFNRHVFNIGM